MLSTAVVLTSSYLREPKCLFCDSGLHSTEVCDGNSSHKDRQKNLAIERRRFCCTYYKRHFSIDCCRNVKRANCSGQHVSSVCDPTWQRRGTDNVWKWHASSLHTSNRPILETEILLQSCRFLIQGCQQCAYVRGIVDRGRESALFHTRRCLLHPWFMGAWE